MDVAVTVRLNDQLTRQSRELQATFAKLTAGANKFAAVGERINVIAKGLGALNRVAGSSNGAVSNITRMSAAIGTLAARHTEIASAATAMTSMARSIRALNDVSGRAIGAANGIRQISQAMSHVGTGANAFTGINTQLREMNMQLRRAQAGMRGLGGGGFGGTGGGGRGRGGHGGGFGFGSAMRHAMVFGGTYAAVEGAKEAIGTTFSRAMSEEDALTTLKIQGASPDTRRAYLTKAQSMHERVKGTTTLDNLNALLDARTAMMGDDDAVLRTADKMAKLRVALGFALHDDVSAKQVTDQVYAGLKTPEMRGMINDDSRFDSWLNGLYKTTIMSHGRVMPQQFFANTLYGRSAAQGWSDRFMNESLPFYMTESAGRSGNVGVSLQAAYRALVLSKLGKGGIEELRTLGLIDESKVHKSKGGGETADPGAFTLSGLMQSDPDLAIGEIVKRLRNNGTTDRNAIIQKLATILPTGTAQSAGDIFGLQEARLKASQDVRGKMETLDQAYADIQNTSHQAAKNLEAELRELAETVGRDLLPPFQKLATAATTVVGVFDRFIAKNDPHELVPRAKEFTEPEDYNSFKNGLLHRESFTGGPGTGVMQVAAQYAIVNGSNIIGGAGAGSSGSGIINASWGGGGSGSLSSIGRFSGGRFSGGGGKFTAAKDADGVRIMDKLVARGVTPEGAAILAGNSWIESKFNPKAVGDHGTSIGLFQHHAARARQMMALVRGGMSPEDAAIALGAAEAKRMGFAGVHSLNNAGGISHRFEGYSTNSTGARVNAAEHFLKEYKRKHQDAPISPPKSDANVEARNWGGDVHITNHFVTQPHHDEEKIVRIVHDHFRKSVESQLSDGYGSI